MSAIIQVDLGIRSPWRNVLPKELLELAPDGPGGTIYMMSERLLFIREIEPWSEVKSLMTPLGYPAAIGRERELNRLKKEGARHYCEIWPAYFRLHRSKLGKRGLSLYLKGPDGREFGVDVLGKARNQKEDFDMILRRFKQ